MMSYCKTGERCPFLYHVLSGYWIPLSAGAKFGWCDDPDTVECICPNPFGKVSVMLHRSGTVTVKSAEGVCAAGYKAGQFLYLMGAASELQGIDEAESRIDVHAMANRCHFHKKSGESFNQLVPLGMSHKAFFMLYPYILGMMYGAKGINRVNGWHLSLLPSLSGIAARILSAICGRTFDVPRGVVRMKSPTGQTHKWSWKLFNQGFCPQSFFVLYPYLVNGALRTPWDNNTVSCPAVEQRVVYATLPPKGEKK